MLNTHCSITGYRIASADAFTDFKCSKLIPSEHPIFSWKPARLHDFISTNFVSKQHQIERVLLIHAMLKSCGLVVYHCPMFLDSNTKDNSAHINRCFTLVVNAFKYIRQLQVSTNKLDHELLKDLPTYRVTKDNCDSCTAFAAYCERLSKRAHHIGTTKNSSEYDLAEDTLNFKLALLGLDANSLEENDRLPKVFTESIADWAAYHYCLATGAEVGSAPYYKITKMLTTKVGSSTNINEMKLAYRLMGEVLPRSTEFDIDNAKTILTLKRFGDLISEYSELMSTLLGTEVEHTEVAEGGISWTVVTTKPTSASTPPLPKPVQNKELKRNVNALLQRVKVKLL